MTSYSYAQPRSSLITCYPNLNYCVLYFNQVIMSKALKDMIKEYLGPNKKKNYSWRDQTLSSWN